jgi:hypothetical protein
MRHMILLLALFLPSLLAAQDSLATRCRDKTTTVDMERCASRDLDRAKRELDRYLEEARRLATNRALLDSAQSVWEHYRMSPVVPPAVSTRAERSSRSSC